MSKTHTHVFNVYALCFLCLCNLNNITNVSCYDITTLHQYSNTLVVFINV